MSSPPRSQPAASPQGAGLGVSTDPRPEQGSPEAAPAAVGRSALHLSRRDRPAALRQPEPSALAPALPSLTSAPLSAKCKCFINRAAERHKTPQAGKSPHVATTARAGVPRHWHRGDQISAERARAACPHCFSLHADPPTQRVATVSYLADASQGNWWCLCSQETPTAPAHPGCLQPALTGRNVLAR